MSRLRGRDYYGWPDRALSSIARKRTCHAFFYQLSQLAHRDRCGLAVAVTVDFADMFDDADLHRYGFKLRLANGVFAAAADAIELMLGKFVDDLDPQQIGRQRLALAATLGGGDNLFKSQERRLLAFCL